MKSMRYPLFSTERSAPGPFGKPPADFLDGYIITRLGKRLIELSRRFSVDDFLVGQFRKKQNRYRYFTVRKRIDERPEMIAI